MRGGLHAGPAAQARQIGPALFLSDSAEATKWLGECLGEALQADDVVILSGDLGAGKTCFTKGVSRALGDSRPVVSPTFTLMSVHDQGRLVLYHFDLYRLDGPEQLEDVGVFDALEAGGACLIEWGKAYADELADGYLEIVFTRQKAPSGAAGAPASPGDAGAPHGPGGSGGSGQTEPARLVGFEPHGPAAQALYGRLERIASPGRDAQAQQD